MVDVMIEMKSLHWNGRSTRVDMALIGSFLPL